MGEAGIVFYKQACY